MKVYAVVQPHENYDTYYEYVIGVYSSNEKALQVAKEVDAKCVISDEEIYSIVPEDIYDEYFYEYDEEEIQEYKGYTTEQFEAQKERLGLYHTNFSECQIKEYELNADPEI